MIGDRWGVTDAEVARVYPCDGLVTGERHELWRGVTINATPAQVWPWLRQVQLAPYSYDKIDNLGRRSPQEIQTQHEPAPGERFSTIGGKHAVGRVVSVVPEEHLTATIMGAFMSYVLVSEGATTRLLLKVVVPSRHWYSKPLALGDWPMARRQLLNLKALAETAA